MLVKNKFKQSFRCFMNKLINLENHFYFNFKLSIFNKYYFKNKIILNLYIY